MLSNTEQEKSIYGRVMVEPMRAIFYSYDGRVWYWARYSKEDVLQLRQNGLQIMADNWWNRRKLS